MSVLPLLSAGFDGFDADVGINMVLCQSTFVEQPKGFHLRGQLSLYDTN